MDIKLDKGIGLNEDQIKQLLKELGRLFVRECRLVLNSHLSEEDLPVSITGELARSISARVSKDNVLKITARTRYATSLFTGSVRHNGVQVKGRPLFDFVMARLSGRIQQLISKIQIEVKE